MTTVPFDPHQKALTKSASSFSKIGLQRLCPPRPLTMHLHCSGSMAVGDHDLQTAHYYLCVTTGKVHSTLNPKSYEECSAHNPVFYFQEAWTVFELSSGRCSTSILCFYDLLSDLWALFWNRTLKHLWVTYWCFVISLINHNWYTRPPLWKLQSVPLHWFTAKILQLVSQGSGVCQATALCRIKL